MFSDTVDKHSSHLALHTRDRQGEDVKWTYEEYMEDVRNVAKGFLALGLDRFHTVGCLGYNAPEWVISHVAAVHAGGFGLGIYQEIYDYISSFAIVLILSLLQMLQQFL